MAKTPKSAPAGSQDGGWRYLTLVGAAGFLAIASYLGLAVGFASYSRFQALSHVTYHDEGFTQLALPLTLARIYWLRGLVLAAAGVGLILLIGSWDAGRHWALLRAEIKQASHRSASRWKRLPMASQLIATGVVLLLVAVRVWYLLNYPLGTDEVASYDYFVREGPLTISSFYPIPNNHIFFNLLASPLAAAGLTPRFVMRLPTLVWGTAGTVAGYALLARLMGLRRATLITGLVGLLPLWVYYAAVGRGYFVQFCLLQAGFFAGLELLRPATPYRRLSWLIFIASSVLGLYTIPTYAYPLVSLLVGIGGILLVQKRWREVSILALAAAIIGALTLLLYAPVIAVSGWESLVANRYVATKTAVQFWPAYRAVLYETAAQLLGAPVRFSGPAWLAAALLGVAAVRRWVAAGHTRSLGYLATAMVAVPLLLMAVQRVYAPLRTILYVSFFGYVLALLLLAQVPIRRKIAGWFRWSFVLLLIMGLGSVRLYLDQKQVREARHETQQLEQAYHWLQTQPTPSTQPAKIWLNAPLHELFFAHYAQQDKSQRIVLYSGSKKGPSKPYDFAILDNYFLAADKVVHAAYHEVYHDDLITIFAPNTTGPSLR